MFPCWLTLKLSRISPTNIRTDYICVFTTFPTSKMKPFAKIVIG